MTTKEYIKQELEKFLNRNGGVITGRLWCDAESILDFLDTLQDEHLIDANKMMGLDEAAEKLSDSECAKIYGSFSTKYDKDGKCLVTTLVSGNFETIKEFGIKLFKAGAEWIAGQGVTIEKTVGQLESICAGHPTFYHGFEVSELDADFLNSKEVGYGDKVIVQVRKK